MTIKQPNSLHCFVCGVQNPYGLKLKFFEEGPGEVIANYTVPKQFQGYPGVVHGGIIAAMLDEVAGRTLMGSDPQRSRFMFTARLDVQYRKPVPTEKPLRLVGRVGKLKNRSATAVATIYGPDGDLLAEADAILVDIPQETLETANLEALGWKVYPDNVEQEAP
jgi:uncharacterized protein (TIGR00369 family)